MQLEPEEPALGRPASGSRTLKDLVPVNPQITAYHNARAVDELDTGADRQTTQPKQTGSQRYQAVTHELQETGIAHSPWETTPHECSSQYLMLVVPLEHLVAARMKPNDNGEHLCQRKPGRSPPLFQPTVQQRLLPLRLVLLAEFVDEVE